MNREISAIKPGRVFKNTLVLQEDNVADELR